MSPFPEGELKTKRNCHEYGFRKNQMKQNLKDEDKLWVTN